MKKKTLFISIGVSIAVALAVVIPVSIIYSKKGNDSHSKKENTITFTFPDIKHQGPREEGGAYWDLVKYNGSPTGTQDFGTKMEYDTEQERWNYYSYVDGDDFDTKNRRIVNIYKDPNSESPNTTLHFEFVLPTDATFTGAYLVGNFYTNSTLTKKITKVEYSQEYMQDTAILESINEYYQIELDKIVFTYNL